MAEKGAENKNGLPFTPFGYKLIRSFFPLARVLSLVCKQPKPPKEITEAEIQYIQMCDMYFWGEAITPLVWSYTYWMLWTVAICSALVLKTLICPVALLIGTMVFVAKNYRWEIKFYYELLQNIDKYPKTPEFNKRLSETSLLIGDENINIPYIKAMAIHRLGRLITITELKQKAYLIEKIGILCCIFATSCYLLFR